MAFSPAGTGQLLIFRVRVPTVDNQVSEALGDDLESVGSGLSKMGRQFPLTVTVRGLSSDLPDPYSAGQRLRRQLRSLMENAAFKMGGLYLQYLIDTEISGWFLIGGVDLAYGDGGFTLADYTLTLRDALRVGGRYSHRAGRRFTVLDRRLSSTPLDYRCLVYNTAFTAYPGTPQVFLPYNVSDIRSTTRQIVIPTTTVKSIDSDTTGSIPAVTPTDAQIVSYEQAESDMYTGQVVLFDRRGVTAPTFTVAGDQDPQSVYGWEEVYGAVYPLSADVPVLANGICRVRWLGSPGVLAVDWNAVTRNVVYTEMMRVIIKEETAASTFANLTTLASATIAEYTDDRATVKLTLSGTNIAQDVYVSLQRGWNGPRIEQYTSVPSHGASMDLVPFNSGATTTSYRHNGATTTVTTGVTVLDYQSTSVGDEPWVNISPTNTGVSMVATLFETGLVLTGIADTTAYGATRNGVRVQSPFNSTAGATPVPYWNAAEIDFYASGTITLASAQASAGSNMFDARSLRTVVTRGS